MTGKTHLAGGTLAAAAVAVVAPGFLDGAALLGGEILLAGIAVPVVALGTGVCLLASLLPDIDEPDSLIVNSPAALRKRLPRGRSVQTKSAASLSGVLFGAFRWILRGVSGIIRLLAGGHRGATHWLLIAAVLSYGMWHVGSLLGYPALWLWFSAGYISHLILDMLTPAGLEVLRPITPAPIHLLPGFMRIRTGGGGDTLVRVLLFMGAGALAYQPLLGI
ncbi:MAG: metal-dependent hydrolase [Bacteroidia bacterium]|nr:metal-dependent hydrolase [Bacteroidia bacterium]